MGGYAWWSAFQRGRQALELWGSDAAVRIRYAKRVELWELRPDEPGQADRVRIGDLDFFVTQKTDISKVKGLVHARHALVEDASFLWPLPPETPDSTEECSPDWQFALHFVGADQTSTVAFDTGCGRVRLLPDVATLTLQSELVEVYRQRPEQWKSDPASSAAGH